MRQEEKHEKEEREVMENPKEEELARLCRKEDGNRETNKRQKEWTEG